MQKSYKKRRGKKIYWIGGVFLLCFGGIIWAWGLREKPPVDSMEEARQALSEAEKAGAVLYRRDLYDCARSKYDSAMLLWREENKKWIFFRQFGRVTQLAKEAKETARKAIVQAGPSQVKLEKQVKEKIGKLRREMERFDPLFVRLPLGKQVKEDYARGKLLLNEAEAAVGKENYISAWQKEKKACETIQRVYEAGEAKIKDYLKGLPEWQQQKNAVVEYSRRTAGTVVVIEKLTASCRVYKKGKESFSCPVEFGPNWLGKKYREGDKATPEGEYKVRKKLQGKATRYHKALLLNYPNEEDLKNFNLLKKNGNLPAGAKTGGAIEIHGEGGRGTDWTDGCVALDNRDMDRLFRLVETGTPVIIIGASEAWKELRKTEAH